MDALSRKSSVRHSLITQNVIKGKGPFKNYVIPLLKVVFGCMRRIYGHDDAIDLGGR